jgi:hypothetical protein
MYGMMVLKLEQYMVKRYIAKYTGTTTDFRFYISLQFFNFNLNHRYLPISLYTTLRHVYCHILYVTAFRHNVEKPS